MYEEEKKSRKKEKRESESRRSRGSRLAFRRLKSFYANDPP